MSPVLLGLMTVISALSCIRAAGLSTSSFGLSDNLAILELPVGVADEHLTCRYAAGPFAQIRKEGRHIHHVPAKLLRGKAVG